MTTATVSHPKIRDGLRRGMYDDARLAGMIIYAEPEAIGDEAIGDFLMRIKCIRRETVYSWLEHAGVNPWRAGNQLSAQQRGSLARQLTDFWKAGQS
jgi:hypothetical protein